MLLNNIESDLKTKLEEEGITQKEFAGQIGVSLPYVNRITRGREQLVNKTFLKMLDELGFDVELTYKKKAAEWCVDSSGFTDDYMKKKSDLMWSISLIAIGIATIILASANIVGIDLPDMLVRLLGIVDLVALPILVYSTIKR